MASFKLCISDPSTGKTFQKEVKDNAARPLIGLNIGENVKGETIEMSGYEFQITGGSDYCGFPMRSGILGLRKKIAIYGGVGFRGGSKGIKRRKTVVGHKIHDRISQINLKVVKQGTKKLAEIFGKEEKAGEKEAEKKEGKQKEGEIKIAEEKKEAKPAEHKEEAKAKEHKKHEQSESKEVKKE